MKQSSLLQHITIALGLSCLAAISGYVSSLFLETTLSVRLNLSFILFLYLSYLIRQNHLPAGRLTLMALNTGLILIFLLTEARLNTLVWVYPGMIWITRSLLRYLNVYSILADLILCLCSTGTALWLIGNGYGLMSALWCFLLLQALHIVIPGKKSKQHTSGIDKFNSAAKSAESALQQLSRNI